MAHFAELDHEGFVLRVLVIADEHESRGEAYCHAMFGGRWKQTSYNTRGNKHSRGKTPLHMNFAGVGHVFDGATFYPPKPYPSWTKDGKGNWTSPKPIPEYSATRTYTWNESMQQWDSVRRQA